MIREAGGDRSAVTGGTRVLSDQIKVKITSNPGETFLDRMIALVEGAERQKTPNEIALNILLAGLTIIFLLAVVTLQPFAIYSGSPQTVFVLVSLLVCLIPTTIGGLLSAIGIAGMDRLVQHNVLAMSGRAVEAAGDVNTLLLDKTGTITLGNRQAHEFIPAPGVTETGIGRRGAIVVLADETPEGRSIVVLAKEKYGLRGRELELARSRISCHSRRRRECQASISNGCEIRKGAADAIAELPVSKTAADAKRSQSRGGRRLRVPEGRLWWWPRRAAAPGRDRAQRHREGRNARALQSASRHGHQDRDDHRRQPADSRGNRARSGSRRFPRPGNTERQDGPDQDESRPKASWWR